MLDPIAPADLLDMLLSSGMPIPSNRAFLNRIAQVACERHNARRVDQDVPTMIINPMPLTKQQKDELLGHRLNYVLIFGAESIYFQDTVHALAVDGYRSGGVNVLGAHIDWISSDGKSIERCLAVDETGLVKEMAFEEPVSIHVVQILHLPLKRERGFHKELSRHFREKGISQINPYDGVSERADDKSWTHMLWKRCGRQIESPECVLITQGSSREEIVEYLRSFINNTRKSGVVIQPNKSTEGRKVEKFSLKAGLELLPIVDYIRKQVLPGDDAIVRELRGNVRYRNQLSDLFLNVAFRINVAWNGSEFVAESGYAQIAKDEETFPASRGRGGSITDINDAFANLYYLLNEKWNRLIITDEDVTAMKIAAVNAAYGLNAGLGEDNYLKHMGIDVLLEVCESESSTISMLPVVLEANPRPAGLSHSTELTGISGKKPQPRISTEIFGFAAPAVRR